MKLKIIWLNGMPRSGTSWLSQIFDSHPDVRFKLSPLFSYAFKNALDSNSTKKEWKNFFKEVYFLNNDFLNQTNRRKTGEYPIFKLKNSTPNYLAIKETRYHNLTKRMLDLLRGIKFIHIIRNPCGAINSWLKAPREFPKDADPSKEWKTGVCRKTGKEEFWGFNDWKLLTSMYLDLQKKFPNKVLVICYEDLVDEPFKITRKIFDFVNLNLHQQTMNFLISSNSKHHAGEYAVFKNKDVKYKWKRQLSPKIIKEIYSDLKRTPLEKYLNV